MKVFVVGHTDLTGDLAANMKLSQARAQTVIDALVAKHGIAAARMTAFGNGPYAPLGSNATEEGRAKNRRVELVDATGPAVAQAPAADPGTKVAYTCTGHLRFTAAFTGAKGDDLLIEDSSGGRYNLRRTAEMDGRKYANEPAHAIFVFENAKGASLTINDVPHKGCRGQAPDWLVAGKPRP